MSLVLEHLLLVNIIPTPNRLKVLSLFLQRPNAFSLNMVSQELVFLEKSTIFRILQLLELKGILHIVVTADGIKNYVLCTKECTKDNHAHHHAHLKCTTCKLLYCIPIFSLPIFQNTGIQIESVSILANGVCEDCNPVAA